MPRSSAASSRRRRSDALPSGLAWDDGDHAEPPFQIIQVFGELLEGFVSTSEELLQHGSEGVRGDIVGLTFQGAALRFGEGVCNR